MKATIRVEGIDKAMRFGDLIAGKVTGAIQKETDEGAKAIQKRERELAPKLTGDLRRKVVVRKGKYGISKMVRAKAPHAPLQEYGTKRGVKAKEFSRKARDELLPGIEAKIRQAVAREVKE